MMARNTRHGAVGSMPGVWGMERGMQDLVEMGCMGLGVPGPTNQEECVKAEADW